MSWWAQELQPISYDLANEEDGMTRGVSLICNLFCVVVLAVGCGVGDLGGQDDPYEDDAYDNTYDDTHEEGSPEEDGVVENDTLVEESPNEDEDGIVDEATQTSAAAAFTLYVAPDGSDSADGLTPSTPLKTLMGAQEALRVYKNQINQPVEVRIKSGTYTGQEVLWDLIVPNQTISFIPSDFHFGKTFTGTRPVFDGKSVCSKKAPESAGGGEFCRFFKIVTKSSVPTRLRFYYLRIRYYTTTGIGLHNKGEGRNVVYGCRFEKIGNLYFPNQRHGFTAIGISNSDHNIVKKNIFVDIRNKAKDVRFMHAVYLNVKSAHNRVRWNSTLRVSGDPMKVRHFSNNNVFEHNTLRYSGVAGFLDWPESGECYSWRNAFRYNTIRCGYGGGKSSTIKVKPPQSSGKSCGSLGVRVYSSGNSNQCP
jgi:hypothetical protein